MNLTIYATIFQFVELEKRFSMWHNLKKYKIASRAIVSSVSNCCDYIALKNISWHVLRLHRKTTLTRHSISRKKVEPAHRTGFVVLYGFCVGFFFIGQSISSTPEKNYTPISISDPVLLIFFLLFLLPERRFETHFEICTPPKKTQELSGECTPVLRYRCNNLQTRR